MVKDLGSSNLTIICIHINNKGQRTHIQIIKKLSGFTLGEIPWSDVCIWSCPVFHWVKFPGMMCIFGAVRFYIG